MPRQRMFDRDRALDAAMHAFWRGGYEATSVQDLVECMGINRGSLYGAFGDKFSLMREALERYEETVVGRNLAPLAGSGPPLARIRRFFDGHARRLTADPARRGCLMVNTAVELGEQGGALSHCTKVHFDRLQWALEALLDEARASGDVADSVEPRAMARYLVGVMIGMNVLSKAGATESDLFAMIDIALGLAGRA